jgi:hypothetical protein
VRLLNFGQDAEPFIVLDRFKDRPALLSIRRHRRETAAVFWRLPSLSGRFEAEIPPIPPTSLSDECLKPLHATWLVRSPVALSTDGGHVLVFSRFRIGTNEPVSATNPPGAISLDLMIVQIADDASCSPPLHFPLALGKYNVPARNSEVETPEEWTARAYTRLRGRPVLFHVRPDGMLLAVLPGTHNPASATSFSVALPGWKRP